MRRARRAEHAGRRGREREIKLQIQIGEQGHLEMGKCSRRKRKRRERARGVDEEEEDMKEEEEERRVRGTAYTAGEDLLVLKFDSELRHRGKQESR